MAHNYVTIGGLESVGDMYIRHFPGNHKTLHLSLLHFNLFLKSTFLIDVSCGIPFQLAI